MLPKAIASRSGASQSVRWHLNCNNSRNTHDLACNVEVHLTVPTPLPNGDLPKTEVIARVSRSYRHNDSLDEMGDNDEASWCSMMWRGVVEVCLAEIAICACSR